MHLMIDNFYQTINRPLTKYFLTFIRILDIISVLISCCKQTMQYYVSDTYIITSTCCYLQTNPVMQKVTLLVDITIHKLIQSVWNCPFCVLGLHAEIYKL